MPNPTRTVVLIHGYLPVNLLGLGVSLFGQTAFAYFKGVAQHTEQLGVRVQEPTLPNNSRVEQRGAELARVLGSIAPPPEGGRDLILIAHSMGGLDARWVLHHHPALAARTHSLVTLGTPFRGSPLADLVGSTSHKVPDAVAAPILSTLGEGVKDLTRAQATSLSNACIDPPGIHRFCIVGNPDPTAHSHLFGVALRAIDLWEGKPSDGVVQHYSATWPGFVQLPDWPVDHAGLIGWGIQLPLLSVPGLYDSQAHLQRYTELVQHLLALADIQP